MATTIDIIEERNRLLEGSDATKQAVRELIGMFNRNDPTDFSRHLWGKLVQRDKDSPFQQLCAVTQFMVTETFVGIEKIRAAEGYINSSRGNDRRGGNEHGNSGGRNTHDSKDKRDQGRKDRDGQQPSVLRRCYGCNKQYNHHIRREDCDNCPGHPDGNFPHPDDREAMRKPYTESEIFLKWIGRASPDVAKWKLENFNSLTQTHRLDGRPVTDEQKATMAEARKAQAERKKARAPRDGANKYGSSNKSNYGKGNKGESLFLMRISDELMRSNDEEIRNYLACNEPDPYLQSFSY